MKIKPDFNEDLDLSENLKNLNKQLNKVKLEGQSKKTRWQNIFDGINVFSYKPHYESSIFHQNTQEPPS